MAHKAELRASPLGRWRQRRTQRRREREAARQARWERANACPKGGFHEWEEWAAFHEAFGAFEGVACHKCGKEVTF